MEGSQSRRLTGSVGAAMLHSAPIVSPPRAHCKPQPHAHLLQIDIEQRHLPTFWARIADCSRALNSGSGSAGASGAELLAPGAGSVDAVGVQLHCALQVCLRACKNSCVTVRLCVHVYVCIRMCVLACVCVREYACVRVCARARSSAWAHLHLLTHGCVDMCTRAI